MGRRTFLLHLLGFPCQYLRRVDRAKFSTPKIPFFVYRVIIRSHQTQHRLKYLIRSDIFCYAFIDIPVNSPHQMHICYLFRSCSFQYTRNFCFRNFFPLAGLSFVLLLVTGAGLVTIKLHLCIRNQISFCNPALFFLLTILVFDLNPQLGVQCHLVKALAKRLLKEQGI